MIASVLLGSHPPALPVASLVRVGELFGIADGTIRVALSRMTADGELEADHGSYRLAPSFAPRQAAQDRGRRPALRPWRGAWEVVVADPGTATAGFDDLRLARAGGMVWMRPANLLRGDDDAWPAGARRLEADGDGDEGADRALAARLWDLAGWASTGRELLDRFDEASRPADRFVVAAAILRHLRHDPVLPASLVDAGWPDEDLRSAYSAFTREVGAILATTTHPNTRPG